MVFQSAPSNCKHFTKKHSPQRFNIPLPLQVLLGALALSAPSPASAQDNLVRGASGGVSTSASGAKPGAAGGGEHGHHSFECSCMEYWTCVTSGGEIYSYCGIGDGEVCCFVPRNAEPVGILPTPSRARCGKKGFDSGQVGTGTLKYVWESDISCRL